VSTVSLFGHWLGNMISGRLRASECLFLILDRMSFAECTFYDPLYTFIALPYQQSHQGMLFTKG
jgi:hypothetical protein